MTRQWQTAMLAGVVVLAAATPAPAQDDARKAEVVTLIRRVQALQKEGKLQEAIKVQEQVVAKEFSRLLESTEAPAHASSVPH